MNDKWPILNNPPVVAALFQLKFNAENINIDDFLSYDVQLKRTMPNRMNNIQVGINLGGTSIPLGVSTISGTTDAKVGSYVYSSEDQKLKLEISNDTITYINENLYKDWNSFKTEVLKILSIVSNTLEKTQITRNSIRFINRFSFESFDNPEEYFNMLISSNNDGVTPYPLQQYGFRIVMSVLDSEIHSIVNQGAEYVQTNTFIYTFDIDVLDKQQLPFNIDSLSMNMERLRDVKNKIFFDNITEKTLKLCN